MTLLLRTVLGSRLYGFAHADSDYDYFEVYGYDKFKAKQTITNESDTLRMSLDTFLRRAGGGSPQSLEAMWSRQADVDLLPWRFNFLPNMGEADRAYVRTIKNFAASPDRKRQRHAWRLKLNHSDLMNLGHFNPTLDEEQQKVVEWMVDHKVHPLSY